jgi:hypothetical protein
MKNLPDCERMFSVNDHTLFPDHVTHESWTSREARRIEEIENAKFLSLVPLLITAEIKKFNKKKKQARARCK